MNFIFNKVPDFVSKILVLCSLHFTMDLFTKEALNAFFRKIELKDDVVPTIGSDSNVATHKCK